MDWHTVYAEVKPSVIVWLIILIALAVWEFWTVLDGKPHTLPLTWVTVTWVPGAVTMAFLTWLWVHFLIRYLQTGHWWFR